MYRNGLKRVLDCALSLPVLIVGAIPHLLQNMKICKHEIPLLKLVPCSVGKSQTGKHCTGNI